MHANDHPYITRCPRAASGLSGHCFDEQGKVLLNVRRPKPFFNNIVARKTGWFYLLGYESTAYKFGGEVWHSEPAPEVCEEACIVAYKALESTGFEPTEEFRFTSVLVQVYGEDGEDGSIAWHSDDEDSILRLLSPDDEMEVSPIVSVSFGATCKFSIRPTMPEHKARRLGGARRRTTNVTLEDGDALVMHQGMQERYEHCIKKKDIDAGIRISFTFRAQQ